METRFLQIVFPSVTSGTATAIDTKVPIKIRRMCLWGLNTHTNIVVNINGIAYYLTNGNANTNNIILNNARLEFTTDTAMSLLYTAELNINVTSGLKVSLTKGAAASNTAVLQMVYEIPKGMVL